MKRMVAMCRNCENEPLVCTMAFYKKEFICLNCGSLFEWLQPASADETPELLEKMHALEKEWNENAGKHLLTVGAKRRNCDKCSRTDDYSHKDHATAEEVLADEKAREWIKERIKVAA